MKKLVVGEGDMMPNQNKRIKSMLGRFFYKYLSPQFDLRIRLYNTLVITSIIFCIVIGIVNLVSGVGIVSVIVDLAAAIFCYVMLQYASKSGRAQLCHALTIVIVFFLLFPYLFFKMGGYHGGIPVFLVFAVVFTVFMLEGKLALVIAVLEILFYAGLYIFAYTYPQTVNKFSTEKNYLISNLMDLVVVSIALGATIGAQTWLYREQQKRLDEQNAILTQINHMKTEFLANASHEMRTPLTVASVNIQTVMEILEDMGERLSDPEAQQLLGNAQSEIMRLSRMVGSMLALASMTESTDRQKQNLTTLLDNGVEMLRLNLEKRGNALETDFEDSLYIFGNADLLSQVLANLLQNAGACTENGRITVRAKKQDNEILVQVQDTGIGIATDFLPHVFERGASTSGTGFGLYLCKTVVESHGGRIWVESKEGIGTMVSYTLPFYEGQMEELTCERSNTID